MVAEDIVVPHEGLGSMELDDYLLTPWSTVLVENVTVSKLVKNFHAFYGTRRFITAFVTARHLSLS